MEERSRASRDEVIRRYHITGREDYHKYNKMCGMVTKLVNIIKKLDAKDHFRVEMTEQLLDRLYNMGVIPAKKRLSLCDKLSVSSFCRGGNDEVEVCREPERGDNFHRTGTYSRGSRHRYRSCFFGHKEYGGLRDLGGYIQDQEEDGGVQRSAR